MRLNSESYERAKHRPQQFPLQEELPNMPAPMTRNRARDFERDCKRCQSPCGYCDQIHDFDPLGR